MVVRRESGELESERVKMESRGNDEKVKFVGPIKSVRQREKVCEPRNILKLLKNLSLSLSSLSFFVPNVPLERIGN